MRIRFLARFLTVFALLTILLPSQSSPSVLASPDLSDPKPPVSPPIGWFVHTATVANTSGAITYIAHPYLNTTLAPIFVMPNWEPGHIYNDHTIGMFYDTIQNHWAIMNQDGANITLGSTFNVMYADDSGYLPNYWQVTSYSNIGGPWTVIDNELFNNDPTAKLLVIYSEGTITPGTHIPHDHILGTAYDTISGKWRIYNEDGADMVNNRTFTVINIGPYTGSFSVMANSGNTSDNCIFLDIPETNNKPRSLVFASHYLGIVSTGFTSNVSPLGVWYTGSQWSIFNQNIAGITTNSVFHGLAIPAEYNYLPLLIRP